MNSERRRRLHKNIRKLVLFLLDIVLVVLAIELATALRYDGSLRSKEYIGMIRKVRPLIPFFTALYMAGLVAGKTYKSRWRYAGAHELARLCFVCAAVALVLVVLNYPFEWHISRMVLMISGMFAAAFVGGSRFMWKICREMIMARRFKSDERVLIVGGGEMGIYAARLCQQGDVSGTPVGFVDDDPDVRGERLFDLPVLGDSGDIPDIVRRRDITQIIIALPSGSGERIEHIVDMCRKTRCKVKILSAPDDMSSQKLMVRELNTSDFLARGEVHLDTDSIRAYVTGRVVMVTGGGGSIGSEICRQLMRFNPKQLIVFDIYENCAYELEQELLNKYGRDCPVALLIGSIRDKARLDEVFEKYKPEIVFHAAAHKHVPTMETAPAEAIKNNVFGTRNLLMSASEHGVKRLVQISTDKAVNPTNVMGATKRITEMLMQQFSRKGGMKCMAVRFGNVLGSHGSIIPLWESQIKAGGPVTLTHEEITRYFMTIPEAAQLVLQAGALAENGAIYVLDMGEPVKMIDLAHKLIRFYGYTPNVDMPIKIIGLRPGEKLYEELLMDVERDNMRKTAHNKIFVAPPIPMDDDELDRQLDMLAKAAEHNDNAAVEALQSVVTTYNPNRDMLAG
ncbi:MAG: polysaccharide biosynthesis protein [Clostridia bacterium]|nr:polysaccharide biosynthesis protein [Clostridia bacterium]